MHSCNRSFTNFLNQHFSFFFLFRKDCYIKVFGENWNWFLIDYNITQTYYEIINCVFFLLYT
jgi:hypothetical protein